VAEAIADGVSGRLGAARDPADHALKTRSQLDDRAAAERLGQAARARRAALFSIEAMVGGMLEVYGEVT
jgi:hypothetical protein